MLCDSKTLSPPPPPLLSPSPSQTEEAAAGAGLLLYPSGHAPSGEPETDYRGSRWTAADSDGAQAKVCCNWWWPGSKGLLRPARSAFFFFFKLRRSTEDCILLWLYSIANDPYHTVTISSSEILIWHVQCV